MQDIVIPVTSPAVSPYTTTVADSTAQTELFGNVLARQLADSVQLDETDTPDTSQFITSATDNMLTVTPSNEQPVELQAFTPDGVSALPNDMLAALLPHNIAAQISISRTQSTQPEATSHNRALSITTSKVSMGYGAPAIASASLEFNTFATALEILKTGDSTKSMTLLADSLLTPESPAQLNAPPPNATALAALQVQTPNAANLNSPIPLSIEMPVTHNAWADEFSQKIVWVATQHGQSAELHLNPPQLGPLDVLIKLNGDQATALFTSSHAVVRDAIEQALPKLREMMADNGIMLGNATVSDQSPKEQQSKQTDQQQKGESWQAKMDQAIVGGGTHVRSGRHHQGSVDTFA